MLSQIELLLLVVAVEQCITYAAWRHAGGAFRRLLVPKKLIIGNWWRWWNAICRWCEGSNRCSYVKDGSLGLVATLVAILWWWRWWWWILWWWLGGCWCRWRRRSGYVGGVSSDQLLQETHYANPDGGYYDW